MSKMISGKKGLAVSAGHCSFKPCTKTAVVFVSHHHISVMELGHLLTRSGLLVC